MTLNIALPENILLSTRQTYKQFEAEAKRAIALKFYVDERLSLGQAAELAGLNKFEFMKFLGENQVSIFHDDDLHEDVLAAEKFAHG